MLLRNSLASCSAFAAGLVIMWLLVERAGINRILAAAISFMVANSLHYAASRWWIFRGTERPLASGYFYFVVNGGIGLLITIIFFAALTRFTSINYLAIRALVSVIAGLAMFALNGILNFRRV